MPYTLFVSHRLLAAAECHWPFMFIHILVPTHFTFPIIIIFSSHTIRHDISKIRILQKCHLDTHIKAKKNWTIMEKCVLRMGKFEILVKRQNVIYFQWAIYWSGCAPLCGTPIAYSQLHGNRFLCAQSKSSTSEKIFNMGKSVSNKMINTVWRFHLQPAVRRAYNRNEHNTVPIHRYSEMAAMISITAQVFQLFRMQHDCVTWTPDSGDSRRV